jgi:hypothetical protein
LPFFDVVAVVVVVVAIVSQTPALGHAFRADDFLHLYQMQDYGFWRFIFTPHGGHVIPTAFSAFYLSRVVFDLNPNAYYGLAIATHAFNAYLLFRIVETSTRRSGLALAAAVIWGSSSLNLGSIGWYSVYGHVLAGMWTLLFLRSVAVVVAADGPLPRSKPWLWTGYLFGAATSFGTGIPIAMLAGPALYFLLPDTPRRIPAVRTVCSLLLVVPVVFMLAHWQHSLHVPVEVATVGVDTNFLERQIVVLAPSMLLAMLAMFEMLLAYGTASLVFGPLLAPSGLAETQSIWIAQAFGALMVLALGYSVWRMDPSRRPRAAAYLLLAAGCYGIIALARATFYDELGRSVLEAASTPRYHYLAPALLAGLLAFVAAERFQRVPKALLWSAPVAGLLLVLANWNAGHGVIALQPREFANEFPKTLKQIEAKIQAAARGSKVVIENKPFVGPGVMYRLLPGDAAVFLIRYPENEVDGRRVYFSESDPAALALWKQKGGERLKDLLIAAPPHKARQAKARRGRVGGRPTKRLD